MSVELRWEEIAGVDETATEIGVREAVYGLVRALRPQLVVETGSYKGGMTEALGRAVSHNRTGRVVSYECNPDYAILAARRCEPLPVRIRVGMSADFPELADADFLFLDSDYRYRADEIARAKRGATIVIHDAYKSYDPSIAPLAPLIEQMGGITFRCGIDGRGFGILIKR